MSDVFEGYVTKSALSAGIQRKRLKQCDPPSMAEDADAQPWGFYHGEGREWHRTWESAVARAEEMRKAKLASLRKSIAKLEKMEWKQP